MKRLVLFIACMMCVSCTAQIDNDLGAEFHFQRADGEILITDAFMTLGNDSNSWISYGAKIYNTTDRDLIIELQFKGIDNRGNILNVNAGGFYYSLTIPANSSLSFGRTRTLDNNITSVELKETKYRIIHDL